MNLSVLRRLPIRLNRTYAVLGIAMVIGVLAALGARNYLSSQVEAIQAGNKLPTVDVVVAKSTLAAGAVLTRDNVAVRQVPRDYAHSTAVVPADFERVEGRPVAYPMRPGDMLFWGLMETKRAPTFSATVKAGRRAITVPVDEINSISGLLEPGDLIDLLASTEHDGHRTVRPLLQQVRVMATGQRAVDDAKTGERRHYSTVTLDTTPQQAQEIIAAREDGKLTALLRNPQDEAQAPQRTLAAAPAAQRRRPVPILYGGTSASMPPGALNLARLLPPARHAVAAEPAH